MDGTQVAVLKNPSQIGFRRLLQCKYGRSPEFEIFLEVLGNLADEALKWKLADEEIGRLLIATNLTKSDGARTVAMRLLDAAGARGRLAGGLRGELLARRFSAC